MDGRIRVPSYRPDPRVGCGPRWGILVLLLCWLALGVVGASQLPLPQLEPTGHVPAPGPSRVACWVVEIASESAPTLWHEGRQLGQSGLEIAIRPGRRSGTQVLVVRTNSLASARAVQARIARLGLSGSTVRALSGAACRR